MTPARNLPPATRLLIVACALVVAAPVHAQPVLRPNTRVAPKPPAAKPSTPAAPAAPDKPETTPPPPVAEKPAATNGETPLPGEKEAVLDCKKFPPGKKFKWELRGEVDLMTMLNSISPMLCKPFIIPGTVRQSKVTILAPDTMTAPEAYRMFLAALESMGLTVQPEGKVLKVIESARARESAIPIYSEDRSVPRQDQYVTRLLRLDNVPVDDVKGVLDRLKGKDGDITVYAPTNTLVITDLATNIRKMEEVVTQLDVAMGGERIFVIKLKTLAASEMAATLQQIFGVAAKGAAPAAGAKTRVTLATPKDPNAPPAAAGERSRAAPGADMSISQIIPDDRNNLLIIVGTEKAYNRVLALVKRLDQANAAARGDSANDVVHVIPLANANVNDVATTLSGLGIGVSRGGGGGPSAPGRPPTPSPTPAPGGAATGQKSVLVEGDVRVAADTPTNSLVVVATGRDYITIRDLVHKLDVVRRQVFVEAVILEVSVDKSRKIGVAWHGGGTVGSGDSQSLLFGGSEPGQDVNSILFSPTALSGLAAGLRGPAIPNADKILGLPTGTSVPAFGVFVQFLQNNGDVNVVSMPHLLTTDNEKASISVGQNLPFPGALGVSSFGSVPGTAGSTPGIAGGIGTSVQRQDVALKLDITPHVNDGDFVRLEIENEISDVANPNFNGLGPSTSKRTLKSQVTVRDQQTIVLGGLIKDRVSDQVDKVPLLGDIPILGYLFKKTNKTILKQNLLIIITPYIIKDPSDLRRIFERKLRERREFMERSSAFKDENDYEAQVDYRRKRGLLEEINRTAGEAELEAGELRAAEAAMHARELEGPIDLPLPPRPTAPLLPGQSTKPPIAPPPPEVRP